MIGKIMSEAAHSIIGMFSAKPASMEQKTSNSDFGSLLRSPEEQPHVNAGEKEISISDDEDVGFEEESSADVQSWETPNVPPSPSQSFGNRIFGQGKASQIIDQDRSSFNRDVMINSESGDEETQRNKGGVASDILSPVANITLGHGSQIGMVSTKSATNIADGRPVNDKLQPGQTKEFQFGSHIRENAAGDEIFPSSDKGLLKLQSLQSQMRGESEELLALPTKTSNSTLGTKGGEQESIWSGLGQSGLRSSPQAAVPVATTDLQKPAVTDGEFAEAFKPDLQPKVNKLETLIEQQLLANSSAQLAVRETIQKPVAFDMSAPQVAERLAAEIADISLSGGTKKFEINPRNLGRMEITFTTRGATEIIEIQTEHRGAKDVIVQHSQLLQDILKSQGRDDLTFRVDVKDNMFSSSRTDGGNFSQQENRDAREQQAMPSPRHQMASSSFESTADNDAASDSSRYA